MIDRNTLLAYSSIIPLVLSHSTSKSAGKSAADEPWSQHPQAVITAADLNKVSTEYNYAKKNFGGGTAVLTILVLLFLINFNKWLVKQAKLKSAKLKDPDINQNINLID